MSQRIRNLFKKSTLFILPMTFAVVVLLIHFGMGNFFLTTVDPEYFHLFNGLNFAIFNLAVDFIHHPGTTVQAIYALSAHMVNLIQPGNDLIQNALNNPEDFIHGANILLTLITTTCLVFLGLFTYRYTGNIFYAWLLQLMPFGSYKIILISARLIPEAALIAPILLLALIMIRYLYDKKRDKNIKAYLIGFAIVGGLGVAGKLLFIPFLIIPLFFLPTLKFKLKYLAYTLIAIVVFAFPIFVNFGKSWEWFGGMFMHSGKWGGGEQNIFDFQSAPKKIVALFNIDKSFMIVLGIAVVELVVFYMLSFFKRLPGNKLNMRMIFGVVTAIVFSMVLVTKHYEAHYFFPTLAFKVFLLFLMTKLLVDVFDTKLASRLISISSLILMLAIVFMQKDALAKDYQNLRNKADRFQERANVLDQYNGIDHTLIISSHYRGSPFIESAMVAGVLMSGHLKTTFLDDLAEMYPNTYFYYYWTDKFYFWDQQKSADEFIDVRKPIHIFIGEGKEKGFEIILDRLKASFPDHEIEVKVVHQFSNPVEYFYELRFIENQVNKAEPN